MTISYTLGFSWSNGGSSLQSSPVISGEFESNVSNTIAADNNPHTQSLAFSYATLQAVYIVSDQNLTLKFNSTSSPAPLVTLTANEPFVWYTGCGVSNPFAANVTTLYAYNATSDVANLSVRTLYN